MFVAYPSFCVKIDGKFREWANTPVFHNCGLRPFARDRSGLDLQEIKMALGSKHLYIYIGGRSVTGLKRDKGQGARKTSIRISFNSAQSPLNRIRIASDPAKPGQIKVSCPGTRSNILGSKRDKYWAYGKYGKRYAFEFKIPVYSTSKGMQVGRPSGPLIALSGSNMSKRTHLSDMLINSVDAKTHRLVDTAVVPIKKGEL